MRAHADKPIYDALVIPNDALKKGGVEILRAGLIDDELYVSARAAFDDPGIWGEALGEVARRIARLYAAGGRLSHRDALAAIAGAFAAELGAPVVTTARKRPAKRDPARVKARTGSRAEKS